VPVELNETDRAQLEQIGAVRLDGVLGQQNLSRLIEFCQRLDKGHPGERIRSIRPLSWVLDEGPAGVLVRAAIGSNARPVRAIFFDKRPDTNWALGWHQDRTIAVENRQEVPGFANWNVKAGVSHVEPPFHYIERMVTARMHLDPVDAENAPLLIAPGSHRLGRIAEADLAAIVRRCGETACLAGAGDIWLYRTAIVHASKRSQGERRRRVLQVDYSADELPGALSWAA
jgi:hypothetical protein